MGLQGTCHLSFYTACGVVETLHLTVDVAGRRACLDETSDGADDATVGVGLAGGGDRVQCVADGGRRGSVRAAAVAYRKGSDDECRCQYDECPVAHGQTM